MPESKRIFLVGTGISLNETPLDLMRNDCVMGINQNVEKWVDLDWKLYAHVITNMPYVSDGFIRFASQYTEHIYIRPDDDYWPGGIGFMVYIAGQLGFKEMYLVAFDCGRQSCMISPGHVWRKHYFSDKRDELLATSPVVDDPRYDIKHDGVLMFAENNGIKIYNATLGGTLDKYPRVNYYGLFK